MMLLQAKSGPQPPTNQSVFIPQELNPQETFLKTSDHMPVLQQHLRQWQH
jgi:hypothetical protein